MSATSGEIFFWSSTSSSSSSITNPKTSSRDALFFFLSVDLSSSERQWRMRTSSAFCTMLWDSSKCLMKASLVASFLDGNIALQKLQTSLSLFSTSISECLFLVTEYWTILIASKIFERLFSEKSSTRPFSPSQILIVDSDSILSHPRPKNSCVLNKYMLEKWNCS